MPDFRVSPISIVDQIKSNLQDRYDSGYPILKELLQNAAIGKFGLGQEAIFHLCDAFVVYAYGDSEPFSTVVNPFLGVGVDGNISPDWDAE